MKNVRMICLSVAIFLIAGAASAGVWIGGSQTHVTAVQFYGAGSDGTDFVMAAVEGGSLGSCDYVKFIKGGDQKAANTDEELRAVESILLTSLTTGLPITIKVYSSSSSICNGYIAKIMRP